ncbi:uncharacterized protein LOC129807320 [Phlebotomus papatasi]|uniref:uncharacterized protein LOC129807320 n=1 Tax=Phlebotomus papatasi TaxID=29031 RepID=UPI002483DC97|nr:uncharacterized protein LOC129807320 [Phlebotomus papatasi]
MEICRVLQDIYGYKKIRKKVIITILRTCIFLCMFLLAAIFIRLTWIRPHFSMHSCKRPCNVLDLPMICRMQFNVEAISYHNLNCIRCHKNLTQCNDCEKKVIAINRQIPSPKIEVCENDIVVVDVLNNIPDTNVLINWNGQNATLSQREQDRIFFSTNFGPSDYRYKFRISQPGFYLYSIQAKERAQKVSEETAGSLIVRKFDLNSAEFENTILIEIIEGDSNINLKCTPNSSLVKESTKFRLIYLVSISNIPLILSVDNHKIKIHAINGNSIKTPIVTNVNLNLKDFMEFSIIYSKNSNDRNISVNFSTEDILKNSTSKIKFILENNPRSSQTI